MISSFLPHLLFNWRTLIFEASFCSTVVTWVSKKPHSAHWGINPPISEQPLLNLKTVQAPPLVFCEPPPKNHIFQWTPVWKFGRGLNSPFLPTPTSVPPPTRIRRRRIYNYESKMGQSKSELEKWVKSLTVR